MGENDCTNVRVSAGELARLDPPSMNRVELVERLELGDWEGTPYMTSRVLWYDGRLKAAQEQGKDLLIGPVSSIDYSTLIQRVYESARDLGMRVRTRRENVDSRERTFKLRVTIVEVSS